MTLYVIVIIRLKTKWRNLLTDAKNAVTVVVIVRRDRYNDDMALQNIYDDDPLRHNDNEYRHQIVILV